FQVVPRFTGLGLREAYAADFGMAVGCSGNALAVDRLAWFARDLRDCYQAFHGPDVRQLRRAQHDVADRVDARFVRALPRIDFDELAFRLDFGFFEADVLRARLASDGDQDFFRFDLLLFAIDCDRHGDAAFRFLYFVDFRTCVEVDAAL